MLSYYLIKFSGAELFGLNYQYPFSCCPTAIIGPIC